MAASGKELRNVPLYRNSDFGLDNNIRPIADLQLRSPEEVAEVHEQWVALAGLARQVLAGLTFYRKHKHYALMAEHSGMTRAAGDNYGVYYRPHHNTTVSMRVTSLQVEERDYAHVLFNDGASTTMATWKTGLWFPVENGEPVVAPRDMAGLATEDLAHFSGLLGRFIAGAEAPAEANE